MVFDQMAIFIIVIFKLDFALYLLRHYYYYFHNPTNSIIIFIYFLKIKNYSGKKKYRFNAIYNLI